MIKGLLIYPNPSFLCPKKVKIADKKMTDYASAMLYIVCPTVCYIRYLKVFKKFYFKTYLKANLCYRVSSEAGSRSHMDTGDMSGRIGSGPITLSSWKFSHQPFRIAT